MKPPTLKLIRLTHLYFGVFISPAVLFFAFTGLLQTFSLHEVTKGRNYTPPNWVVELGAIHKHQGLLDAPAEKPRPAAPPRASTEALAAPAVDTMARPRPAVAVKAAPAKSHFAMKIFFLLVCLGLFTSTLTGITMAYKYKSNKTAVTGLLIAGIVIPLLLLAF